MGWPKRKRVTMEDEFVPDADLDQPLALQLIDSTISQIMDGQKHVSVSWFYDALLDIRSAVSREALASELHTD